MCAGGEGTGRSSRHTSINECVGMQERSDVPAVTSFFSALRSGLPRLQTRACARKRAVHRNKRRTHTWAALGCVHKTKGGETHSALQHGMGQHRGGPDHRPTRCSTQTQQVSFPPSNLLCWRARTSGAVSYTHLTLPTIYSV